MWPRWSPDPRAVFRQCPTLMPSASLATGFNRNSSKIFQRRGGSARIRVSRQTISFLSEIIHIAGADDTELRAFVPTHRFPLIENSCFCNDLMQLAV